MTDTNCGPSVSSNELDSVLTEGGPEASRIRERFHRTMLWKLATGRRSPELKTAVELKDLSGGRISVEGWLETPRAVRGRKSTTARAGRAG